MIYTFETRKSIVKIFVLNNFNLQFIQEEMEDFLSDITDEMIEGNLIYTQPGLKK